MAVTRQQTTRLTENMSASEDDERAQSDIERGPDQAAASSAQRTQDDQSSATESTANIQQASMEAILNHLVQMQQDIRELQEHRTARRPSGNSWETAIQVLGTPEQWTHTTEGTRSDQRQYEKVSNVQNEVGDVEEDENDKNKQQKPREPKTGARRRLRQLIVINGERPTHREHRENNHRNLVQTHLGRICLRNNLAPPPCHL